MSTPYGEFPPGFGEPSWIRETASQLEGTTMTAQTEDPTTEPTTDPGTTRKYVVLLKGKEDMWSKSGRPVYAATAAAAIRMVAAQFPGLHKNDTDTAPVFVAVPVRHWKPVKVMARVETTLALEDA